jgi:MYXO-CTERM domain-containing protein
MVQIADDATPWRVVGFLALVVLAAVAVKKDVT